MLTKNSLDAIYDVTLIYPDAIPQTEKTLLNGQFPKEVKVHFARYAITISLIFAYLDFIKIQRNNSGNNFKL